MWKQRLEFVKLSPCRSKCFDAVPCEASKMNEMGFVHVNAFDASLKVFIVNENRQPR